MTRHVPRHVKDLVRHFNNSGFSCYLVGGAVRSLILGEDPSDFDLATDATPEEVTGLFRRVIPTGIQHGTVTVILRGHQYEVTTFRTEGDYSDARRPDNVEFVRDIHTDLARRDFTMNAIALDPVATRVVDPHGGRDDIAGHLIRAIGDPRTRFGEDSLRMLRAPRFAAQLGFSIDPATLEAISELAPAIAAVSPERIRDEFSKTLLSRSPSVGLRLLHQTGLLESFLPELSAGAGVEQRGNHRYDVLEHSILACDAAPAGDLELRLAALLHDVGKPPTLQIQDDGSRIFHGHDRVSAELTEQILRRLKYPNRVIAYVTHLVRHHMFSYTSEWTDAAVRRFIARVGTENVQGLVQLRMADAYAVAGTQSDGTALAELLDRIHAELAKASAVTVRDLALNGADLMDLGIPRGPVIGTILELLLETVLDDPSQNTPETLTRIAERLYEERFRAVELERD
jgi:putative nucleotidyltransferase with HDIG domain